MTSEKLRVAVLGMGWWSDVLADAIKRSGKLRIEACFTRSQDKREKFAAKYGCRAAPSYEAILIDPAIEAIINTTPNDAHLPTTRAAAAAGKHVFLDKPIANNVWEGRAITEVCRKAGEFASAMGAVLDDADRGQYRIVIGATKGRPIVIAGAGDLRRGDGLDDV